MFESIALIIFVISFGGIVWILVKKIPVLVQMPAVREGIQKESIFSVLKKKIKNVSPDKIILLKALSKIRVLVLKIEKYVDGWLQGMRKKIHTQKQESQKFSTVKSTEEKEKKEEQNNPPAGGSTTLPPSMPV